MTAHNTHSNRRCSLATCLVLIVALAGFPSLSSAQGASGALPDRLTDEQFWKLSKDSSEDDGTFRSDNLLSNETRFQEVIPELLKYARQGRVYMGVGPEQNFTYIAALKPAMAVIVDIRHGNLDVHLMYKALFELSKDRADFVSRLFSRKRPAGLTADSTVGQIFNAVMAEDSTTELYEANLKEIQDHLINKHGFPLSEGDREGIAWALSNYSYFGPGISYNSSLSSQAPPTVVGVDPIRGFGGRGGNNGVDYRMLMTVDDGRGEFRSYLATEANFNFLKDLETRNLLIPVVGDFGGDKAIRAVAQYLKSNGATVSAFYLSNVEQYLAQDGKWDQFCRNVSQLPLDETSMFIRSGRGSPYSVGYNNGVQSSSIASMLTDLKPCALSPR